MKRRHITALAIAVAGIAATTAMIGTTSVSAAENHRSGPSHSGRQPAEVAILSPRPADHTGSGGQSWIVDLNATFPNGTSGYTTPQLTGPGVHNNAAPLPGSFGPGQDEHLPGVVVLDSTTTGFSGPGTNLANLFNITALTDQTRRMQTIQDTWIVGAPLFGIDTDTTVTIAVVADLNHNGVYDDAPAAVPDLDHNGRIDANDLRKLGVASNIATVSFHINGNPTP